MRHFLIPNILLLILVTAFKQCTFLWRPSRAPRLCEGNHMSSCPSCLPIFSLLTFPFRTLIALGVHLKLSYYMLWLCPENFNFGSCGSLGDFFAISPLKISNRQIQYTRAYGEFPIAFSMGNHKTGSY